MKTIRTTLESIQLEHKRKLAGKRVIVRKGGEKLMGQTPVRVVVL